MTVKPEGHSGYGGQGEHEEHGGHGGHEGNIGRQSDMSQVEEPYERIKSPIREMQSKSMEQAGGKLDGQDEHQVSGQRDVEQAGNAVEISVENGTEAEAAAGKRQEEVSAALISVEATAGRSSPSQSMESGDVPALSAGTETEGARVVGEAGDIGPGRGCGREPGREPGGDQVHLSDRERERLAFRYVMGMERGDDELIGEVLGLALDDDQLWEMIEGINLEYQIEEGLG